MMEITWMEEGILAAGDLPEDKDDIMSLHEEGVRAIVSLTEYPLMKMKISPGLLEKLDIIYYHAPIKDQYPPNIEETEEILDFIEAMEEEGRPVYVHCLAGMGRTGTILHAYYLMQEYSLDEVIRMVRHKKPSSDFEMLSSAQQVFIENFADFLDEI